MSEPLPFEIPDSIRKAAIAIEVFFKVNGVEDWVLMGIQSRNEQVEKELAALKAELGQTRKAGDEYIARTDPIISCMSEREEFTCGDCRACWIQKAEALKLKLEGAATVLEKFTAKADLSGNPVWGLEVSFMAREALAQLNGAVVCPRCGAKSEQEAGPGGKCDGTGSDHDGPQCASWVGAFRERRIVDYWCCDCRDYFRAPHQPDPHAPRTPCPNLHTNTFEACCDDMNKREEDDSD